MGGGGGQRWWCGARWCHGLWRCVWVNKFVLVDACSGVICEIGCVGCLALAFAFTFQMIWRELADCFNVV